MSQNAQDQFLASVWAWVMSKIEVWNIVALCLNRVPSRICVRRWQTHIKKQAGAQTYCSGVEQHLSMVPSHSVTMWGNELSFSGSLNKWALIEPDVLKMLQCFPFLSLLYTHLHTHKRVHTQSQSSVILPDWPPTSRGWKQSEGEKIAKISEICLKIAAAGRCLRSEIWCDFPSKQ